MRQQAWSFKAVEKNERRYWGNDGYQDNHSVFYGYTSSVPNHKNVKEGDIAIITDREKVLGISVIEKLEVDNIKKENHKCIHPDCNAKKIRPRKTIKPEWRCENGHEFNEPRIILEPAVGFKASFGTHFKKLTDVTMMQLIAETPRYNIQLSIQEVNIGWANGLLDPLYSVTPSLDAEEADNGTPTLSEDDSRKIIERQIKQRRGQKKFRDQLLKSKPSCAVTGCKLIDILEAAHINPYRNDSHNDISNGLLLRSDIHTLFDLGFFAINPTTYQIKLSKNALNNGYRELEDSYLSINHRLSKQALNNRWLKLIKNRD